MSVDKELIIQNELDNDGKTIHLYFNPEIGLYVAYGFSAFFAAHIVSVVAAFSEDLAVLALIFAAALIPFFLHNVSAGNRRCSWATAAR